MINGCGLLIALYYIVVQKLINNSSRKYKRNECLMSVFDFDEDTAEC